MKNTPNKTACANVLHDDEHLIFETSGRNEELDSKNSLKVCIFLVTVT
jgi:hypothetical protein